MYKIVISLLIVCLYFFVGQTSAMVCDFVGYEKNKVSEKVFTIEACDFLSKEVILADYDTFEHFSYYARDKNSIYFYGVKFGNRVELDDSYEDIYKAILYKKENKIYFKNNKNDLIKISEDGNSFKVIHDYSSEYPSWKKLYVRDSKVFFSIDIDGFGNIESTLSNLNTYSGCDISSLEYYKGEFVDKKNVCGFLYSFPKMYIETVNTSIKQLFIQNSPPDFRINHDIFLFSKKSNLQNIKSKLRSKRKEKLKKIRETNLLIDKQILGIIEYIIKKLDERVQIIYNYEKLNNNKNIVDEIKEIKLKKMKLDFISL